MINNVSFTARYIDSYNVKELVNNKYEDKEVALIELERDNPLDNFAFQQMSYHWSILNRDEFNFVDCMSNNSPQRHIYLLTTQEKDYEDVEPKKVLCAIDFRESLDNKANEIKYLQAHPRCITKHFPKSRYDNVGTAAVLAMRDQYPDKPIKVLSVLSAVEFYKKLGFRQTDHLTGMEYILET